MYSRLKRDKKNELIAVFSHFNQTIVMASYTERLSAHMKYNRSEIKNTFVTELMYKMRIILFLFPWFCFLSLCDRTGNTNNQ